ncbi:MAG: hypothetical protein QXP39_00530 [Candidatus Aenigmatarchaeota archaeon]
MPEDGRVRVKRWICIVCGSVFENHSPPIKCPNCGASKEDFMLEEALIKKKKK